MCNSTNSSIKASVRPLDTPDPRDLSSVVPSYSSSRSTTTSTSYSDSTATSTTKNGSWTINASGSVTQKPGEDPDYKTSLGVSYEKGSFKASAKETYSSTTGWNTETSIIYTFGGSKKK